jgi:hypothetical protein
MRIGSDWHHKSSVADPGCLSRIPDPDFYPSRIPDPKTVTKERGENFFSLYFFCSHKFHKIEYYVIFKMLKKKIWANFQRIVEVFTQKTFNMLSNIWVWDPGSGIRDPGSGKTYSGSRIQGSKRHRIPDPDPQHWASLSQIRKGILGMGVVPISTGTSSFILQQITV